MTNCIPHKNEHKKADVSYWHQGVVFNTKDVVNGIEVSHKDKKILLLQGRTAKYLIKVLQNA